MTHATFRKYIRCEAPSPSAKREIETSCWRSGTSAAI